MKLGTVLIRADASVEVGTGHVMRCLALAQTWQDAGGEAAFAMAESTPAILERLKAERIEVHEVREGPGTPNDAKLTLDVAKACGAEWMVVDGYVFGADYQRRVKDAGLRLLWVDDDGSARHYCADIVLNQNVHARPSFYSSRDTSCRLLLGPKYAVLRREFNPRQKRKREISARGNKVLITMGGSDSGNVSLRVVEALREVSVQNLEAVVVIGGSSPHFESVAQAALSFPGVMRAQRDALNMPELMAWADIAVSAAGSTCWEMCMMGLPAVVIDVAANQSAIAEGLSRLAVSVHAGSSESLSTEALAAEVERLLLSSECRSAMSRRGHELVDGEGTLRVMSELQRV